MKIPSLFLFLFLCPSARIEALLPLVREEPLPVLLVHGIFSEEYILQPLQEILRKHGVVRQAVVPHECYFGQCGLKNVAELIQQAAVNLQKKHQVSQINIVAFSMGALATRYMIQRLGGKEFVHKFVSISGPHDGTYVAYFPQFLTGMGDMRPGSDLIEDLKKDLDPFGKVQVYSIYTPYDLIVIPNTSAILPGSVEIRSFPVALHHQMLKHEDVLSAVVHMLEPELPKPVLHIEKAHAAK